MPLGFKLNPKYAITAVIALGTLLSMGVPSVAKATTTVFQEVNNYWEATQAITGYVDNLIWVGPRAVKLKQINISYGTTAPNYFELDDYQGNLIDFATTITSSANRTIVTFNPPILLDANTGYHLLYDRQGSTWHPSYATDAYFGQSPGTLFPFRKNEVITFIEQQFNSAPTFLRFSAITSMEFVVDEKPFDTIAQGKPIFTQNATLDLLNFNFIFFTILFVIILALLIMMYVRFLI